MEPFIRSDQFNFIKYQTQIIINGHATANDLNVRRTVKDLAKEKAAGLFSDLNEEQTELIEAIHNVEDKAQADAYAARLYPYVIPFKSISEEGIKKLFRKVKKLRVPSIEEWDFRDISYLGWNDAGSNRKYLIIQQGDKLAGLHGTFRSINQKGMCAICSSFQELGLFVSETKGSGRDTFIKRGNYICTDSMICNQHLKSLDKLHDFFERLNG
ncbi:FBP C-terminal treble-clef zinc-finger [Bacillus sp. OV322]|uniref:FusB/FusC family EF-G-binding protein n=1 Tax=Bacillus sp. OV322 TaxID=1882764 RepID=UPI0008F2C200|nr:FusB/FusC family EF-G-binding protein [Bacillus sp. OV322]SFC91620.1 FBP C-terminal treble-clef zinc-finger [Bacillus sp. OV322]